MIFICGCRSPQFRKELRRHGVGITWQFIRKEALGWDRSLRCKVQNGDKAFNITKHTSQASNRSQARNPRHNNPSLKKEKAEAFFKGKCRRHGSTVHTLKDCNVSADVECRNCNKAGYLGKICSSHIAHGRAAEEMPDGSQSHQTGGRYRRGRTTSHGSSRLETCQQRISRIQMLTIPAQRARFLGGQHARHRLHNHPTQPLRNDQTKTTMQPEEACA